MKTLFILASVMVFFLVAPNRVEAQQKSSAGQKQPLPKYRRGILYRDERKELIKLGWQPVTMPNATPCGNDKRCQGFPEVYYCSGVYQAVCIYTWRKKTTLITVYASGEGDQTYEGVGACPRHPTQYDAEECGGGGRIRGSEPIKSKPKISRSTDCAFCGTWNYVGVGNDFAIDGDNRYLKISQAGTGKFKIIETANGADGKEHWENRAFFLKLVNGRLVGRFVAESFLYNTQMNKTTYEITCELTSNNKMRYSVWAAIRGGKPLKFVGTKISQ